jgi:hypothetical protein
VIVAIHQPHYLPWLRYIDKIARSDVFVLLDDAQYTKNGWQNRNRIKCAQGWMYVTVPVVEAFGKPISEVHMNNQGRWRAKHWAALHTNYARAPFFTRYRDLLEAAYQREWEMLHKLSVHILELLLSVMGIRTRLVRSSALGVPGIATDRLVNICSLLGATTYLSGDYAASNHLEVGAFRKRGIEVQLQGWQCQEYHQLYPQRGFIPDLSVLDLLFNEGERSLEILGRCHRKISQSIA